MAMAIGSLTKSGGKGPRPPSCQACTGVVGTDSGSASDLGGGTPAPVPGVNRGMSCFGRAAAPVLLGCGAAAAPGIGRYGRNNARVYRVPELDLVNSITSIFPDNYIKEGKTGQNHQPNMNKGHLRIVDDISGSCLTTISHLDH